MDKPKNIISYKIRNTLFNYLRNKGYFVHESDKEKIFPHPLDEKNVPEKDDVIMQEIWNLKL